MKKLRNLYKKKSGKISLHNQKNFYYMMHFYMNRRLPLSESLDLVHEDTSLSCSLDIKDSLKNGERFIDTLIENNLTDEFIKSCLLIGENSSSYPDAFRTIDKYLEQKIRDKNYFLKIISYPLILLFMLMMLILFLVFFIGPSLYGVFTSMNVEPPWSLKFFYGIYAFVSSKKQIILMVLIILMAIFVSGIFNNRIIKFFERKILKNITINKYLQPFIVRGILWQISILVSSGQGLASALSVVADNVKNITYSKILMDIKQKIFQGQLFSEAMAEYPEYFPAATITYIKIGEKTGQIEENLQSAVAYMEIKCSTLTDRIKQIAQPALVLIAGACITLLLITVMPIINAATNFGGI